MPDELSHVSLPRTARRRQALRRFSATTPDGRVTLLLSLMFRHDFLLCYARQILINYPVICLSVLVCTVIKFVHRMIGVMFA